MFRLHSHTFWAAGSNDVFQWIQVKFGQRVIIRAVSTQGRHTTYNQWVKSYSLNYSSDGLSFRRYQTNKHLTVSIFQTFYHVLIMGGFRLFSFSQEGIYSLRYLFTRIALTTGGVEVCSLRKKAADISRHHWCTLELKSGKRAQKFHTDDARQDSDVGSTSDWMKQIFSQRIT